MIQSEQDHKKYRAITLTNGLRVLLIENNASAKSAAALAVNAGHFNDPKHRQGLAHFLEHMLFLGTEKYPDGSEYQKFISQYNGHHNAWTGTEHTCFFFDVHHHVFSEALARFSDFFISPLLSQSFIEKERQNIDAEFKLKLKDDIRRLYDVHKETINPEHPFSQFSVGNNETLADICCDGEKHCVQQELLEFFATYYCAQFMTLALEGPHSLGELSSLAEQYFSPIKESSVAIAKLQQPLYLSEHQKVRINVCPVKNDKQLIISFAMPSIDEFYQEKPESILAYLLGYEGKGSILTYLKTKQWAFRLTAGSGINGSNFKDFNISIALTELGEEHINDIVTIVFEYISLMKNKPIDEHYFTEKKAMNMLAFNYQETLKPIDSVSQYVINMQHYPVEHYIFGDYIMSHFDQTLIAQLLSYLTPNNMRLLHVSKKNTFNQTSKWYQVPYQIKAINQTLIDTWKGIIDNHSNLSTDIYLPAKNNYIVQKPELVKQGKSQALPQIIHEESGFTAWFKQDQHFNTPKGYIYVNIDCPNALKTPSTIAMLKLFIAIYSDNVVEENYDAELAGIHYHLYSHQGGMALQLSGISEKQPLLLEKLLHSLLHQNITENKFNLLKSQLLNHWKNAEKSKSISQLFSALSSSLQPQKPATDILSKALEPIQLPEFTKFTQLLFNKVSLEAFIHGNWQVTHAKTMISLIQQAFSQRYHLSHHVDVAVIDTHQTGEHTIPLVLPEHDYAAVVYYPMQHKDIKTIAISMILSQLLSPHFFHEMRTEKQLGYLVGVGYVPISYYPGIALYIQSPHTKPEALLKFIHQFIEKSALFIEELCEEEWQQLKHGLIGQLQEHDTTLQIQSQRFWGAIGHKDYHFNRKQQLISHIESLTLHTILGFIEQVLLKSHQPDRVMLTSVKNIKEITQVKTNAADNLIKHLKKQQNIKY